jgi:hypothetical protein
MRVWNSQELWGIRLSDRCHEENLLRHQGNSPISMVETLETLKKGIIKIAKKSALPRGKVRHLPAANEILSGSEGKKKFFKRKSPLIVCDGQQMLDSEALNAQLKREMTEDAATMEGGTKKRRRCQKWRNPE